jgi:hypothetical protein
MMKAQIVEQIELFSEAEQESLEFLPEELEAIEEQRVPDLDSISFEDIAEELEAYFEGDIEGAELEARPGRPGRPGHSNNVGEEWRELGRAMAAKPDAYQQFGNTERKLKKVKSPRYYIEGTVNVGTATGTGQYRVVCLVDRVNGKLRVTNKFWSRSHYGTGSDAKKQPSFQEFK